MPGDFSFVFILFT